MRFSPYNFQAPALQANAVNAVKKFLRGIGRRAGHGPAVGNVG